MLIRPKSSKMVLGILLVLLGLLILTLRYLLRRPKHAVDQLRGPPTLPILGNVLMFLKSKEEVFATFNGLAKTYFPIYRTWIANIPVIHPLHPKYAETILTSTLHISKSHDYDFVSEWLGTGLLTSKGSKWHSRRKLLTPAFHFSILEQFVPVFSEKSRILVTKMRAHVDIEKGVDIVPLVTRCALDVICETAMGHDLHAQDNADNAYVTAVYQINDLIVHRLLRPWLYPGWIFQLSPTGRQFNKCLKVLHNFTKTVIRERRKEYKKNKSSTSTSQSEEEKLHLLDEVKKKTALLDLLLHVSEEEGGLSDEDIREEVDTFMFEGHDTTAMAMSWALYFISAHSDVQARCYEELREIFEGSDRAASMSDLNNMKYLERVIKETLRLRPSVITIARSLDHPLKLDGYREFPANTNIHLNIYNIHRNPEIFPEPEKFDPNRFLPENCVGRHPYAYIPFSAGPRNCIGQKFAMLEMKSLLSTVIRNFLIESCDSSRDYQAVPDLILRPKCGLTTRIFNRDAT